MPLVTGLFGPRITREGRFGITDISFREEWIVTFDERQAKYEPVLHASFEGRRIPQIGQEHPETTLSVVTSLEPRQITLSQWKVVVRYATPTTDGGVQPENPLERLADVRFDDSVSLEDMTIDANGNPVINTAGDAFGTAPRFEVSDQIMTVFWNTELYNAALANTYRDAVNSDEVVVAGYTLGIGVAKIRGAIRATREFAGAIRYWRNEITLRLREGIENEIPGSQWDAVVLDQGFRHWKLTPPKGVWVLTEFQDDKGRQAQVPSLLNGQGQTQESIFPGAPTPFYLHFPRYHMLDFGELGLPTA